MEEPSRSCALRPGTSPGSAAREGPGDPASTAPSRARPRGVKPPAPGLHPPVRRDRGSAGTGGLAGDAGDAAAAGTFYPSVRPRFRGDGGTAIARSRGPHGDAGAGTGDR